MSILLMVVLLEFTQYSCKWVTLIWTLFELLAREPSSNNWSLSSIMLTCFHALNFDHWFWDVGFSFLGLFAKSQMIFGQRICFWYYIKILAEECGLSFSWSKLWWWRVRANLRYVWTWVGFVGTIWTFRLDFHQIN